MSAKVEPKSAPKPCAAAAALLEGGMAEAVIGGALVAVLQDLVGLVDFLEAVLAVVVARIAIGMKLHRQLAEGGLQLGLAAGALNAEDFVVVALGHAAAPLASARHGRGSTVASTRPLIGLQKDAPPGCEPGGDDSVQ